MSFFNGLGLRCPEDKGEADFLQDVTLLADQAAYRADKNSRFMTPLVRAVSMLAQVLAPGAQAACRAGQGPEHACASILLPAMGGRVHWAVQAA